MLYETVYPKNNTNRSHKKAEANENGTLNPDDSDIKGTPGFKIVTKCGFGTALYIIILISTILSNQ